MTVVVTSQDTTEAAGGELDAALTAAGAIDAALARPAAEPVAWQPKYTVDVIEHHRRSGDFWEWAMSVYPTKEQAENYGYGGHEVRPLYASPRQDIPTPPVQPQPERADLWDALEKAESALHGLDPSQPALAPVRAALATLAVMRQERVRGEDWENAAHQLLWESGQEALFDQLAAAATKEADERIARKGPKFIVDENGNTGWIIP